MKESLDAAAMRAVEILQGIDNLGYWAQGAAIVYPDQLALVDFAGADGGERRLTHRQLDARLDRVASTLATIGLRPGMRVAVCMDNRIEFIESVFGALRAGLVVIPLNLRQGRRHLEYALADSGSCALIARPDASPELIEAVKGAVLDHRIAVGPVVPKHGWLPYEELLAQGEDEFRAPRLAPDHPALQPYTSGSTGTPKGVVLTHAGQLWWIRRYVQRYQPGPQECSLVPVPLYHKNAMAGVIKSKLPGGASAVLMSQYEPQRFIALLEKYRCTHATGVPTIFSMAMRHPELLARADLSPLRSLTVGSAPVHDALQRQMEDAFRCKVFQTYGLTEGGPVMFGPPRVGDPSVVPMGSCGQLWEDCEARLIDEMGNDHAERGELWVRNPGVLQSYHKLEAVTAARVRDGWLATGDVFERDANGFWYFRGRTDDMFVCGGENIFPKEVEDLLLTHPAIAEVCVVPAAYGDKGEAPVALVVARAAVCATELQEYALYNGPAYAHPRKVIFVDALPLNGAGKVDRGKLRADYQGCLEGR